MRNLTSLLLILALAAFSGCSEQPVEPEETGQSSFSAEFGGYDASAEEPGFGDESLLASSEGDVSFDDPILKLSSVDSMTNDRHARLFHLRIVWGKLHHDSTVTEKTDWSGSLRISAGALAVRKIIRFEEGQDELAERTDRQLIEWTSFTTAHHDGLGVDIFVPRPRPMIDTSWVVDSNLDSMLIVDTLWPEPAVLTFETGPYSRTFVLRELASLDTVVYLDDSSAVAFHSFQIDRTLCPRGFLSGEWGHDDSGNGLFRGRWTDQHGQVTGHLRGRFGSNDRGERVFFGKWIAPNGRFEGLLRGTWEPHPDHHADSTAFAHAGGKFRGSIYTGERKKIGELKGWYRSADDRGNGFLQGRWKLECRRNSDIGDRHYDDGFGGPRM